MSAARPTTPNTDLPDVAGHAVPLARALDWVGMEGIALPVRVSDGAGGQLQVAASIDLSVNLADPEARGIHMSRLYLQLQDSLARETITPAGLRHLLQESITSQSGLADRARLGEARPVSRKLRWRVEIPACVATETHSSSRT